MDHSHSSVKSWELEELMFHILSEGWWAQDPGRGNVLFWVWRQEKFTLTHRSCCYCSVAKSCPILCNSLDCSAPGSSVLHEPPVFSDSCPLSWWCYLTISSSVAPFSFCLQSFPASGSLPTSWLFASGGQSIRVLATVLPMNIQVWFPLGLTGLISLQSKGLSRVFSSTTISLFVLFRPSNYWMRPTHIREGILPYSVYWFRC